MILRPNVRKAFFLKKKDAVNAIAKSNAFVDFIYKKFVGGKGYRSRDLFQRLFVDGDIFCHKTQMRHEKSAYLSKKDWQIKAGYVVCFQNRHAMVVVLVGHIQEWRQYMILWPCTAVSF